MDLLSRMRVALIGTGAIATKHAQAYRNIGVTVVACSNRSETRGREFARQFGCEFFQDWRKALSTDVDFVDVCTYPEVHLRIVQECAAIKRAVLLEKPIATDYKNAREIVRVAHASGIICGVVSQKRYDDAALFLKRAVAAGRLGRILEADAYVKWFRSDEYYARPGKGSWDLEGGGALINQAIHQADLLLHFVGPVAAVQAMWQLGARHSIESEDIVNALMQYENGATGVLQAATALWPGATERIEIHGAKGTAILAGDQLTSWLVQDDDDANAADPAPVAQTSLSGASDPMAIPLTAFERQLSEFSAAVREQRQPETSAEAGLRALQLVTGIYEAARSGLRVQFNMARTE